MTRHSEGDKYCIPFKYERAYFTWAHCAICGHDYRMADPDGYSEHAKNFHKEAEERSSL